MSSERPPLDADCWTVDSATISSGSNLRCDSPELITREDHTARPPPCHAPLLSSPYRSPVTRPVTVGLPRQATFKRQNSERKDRLVPVELDRRSRSTSRRKSRSPRAICPSSSSSAVGNCRDSASEVTPVAPVPLVTSDIPDSREPLYSEHDLIYANHGAEHEVPQPDTLASHTTPLRSHDDMFELDSATLLQHELDTKWILNLSMHFRDKSDREKFFVTYAQTPTRWRRVTISCDYRDAEVGSLELDLKQTRHQRDKSLLVYESIRESLREIQFYNTVTNLKLETRDGRLHVHVTEDLNEAIAYPARYAVRHVLDSKDAHRRPMEIPEGDLVFSEHLSGFVYRVLYQGKTYIKKEIPGPDTIDEFLYEINALHALEDSDHVIKLEAIVVDNWRQTVKGLLISHAERGAVVDILYDHKGQVPWSHRERWARQAVTGLCDIHEEGYVQGDFTLSNIVVDKNNNAKIIDINRRGCPVGWEPPEIAEKISSNQRISMYIGEKSDIYQLGMSLWALAMDDDEPERHDPPLSTAQFPSDVPQWFANIVRICLSKRPRDRKTAKELVDLFPKTATLFDARVPVPEPQSASRQEKKKRYIDPEAAVERDDIERFLRPEEDEGLYSPQSSKNDPTFTWPKSSDYGADCGGSTIYEERRGRQLRRELSSSPTRTSQVMSIQYIDVSPTGRLGYDEPELDGTPYLVSRDAFTPEQLGVPDDRKGPSSTQLSLPLRLNTASPSPLRLPRVHRSASEHPTPRTSSSQLTDIAPSHGDGTGDVVQSGPEDETLTVDLLFADHIPESYPRSNMHDTTTTSAAPTGFLLPASTSSPLTSICSQPDPVSEATATSTSNFTAGANLVPLPSSAPPTPVSTVPS